MNNKKQKFIYTYVHHINEFDLCRMEMRAFFDKDTPLNHFISEIEVEPSRSPFIQERLEVFYEGNNLEEIKNQIIEIKTSAKTYKVFCLNKMDLGETKKIQHQKRQVIERELGLLIEGEPDLENPEIVFGILHLNDRWYFGIHEKSESIWRHHMHKPRSYSTALNTRMARAIANIAVPHPKGIRAIDPLCGIGTVLVEALSMGINIVGRDINPIVCQGSRENIAYFGLHGTVTKGPISEITEHYDVAIIDLPYNLATHISQEDQFDIIKHARRIAKRVVFVTIENIDDQIREEGFEILDRCIARKHLFERQILLCV
ncbi:methyltransferase [Lysinibacillus sp. PLM2]|nr:methyltransferase [Lysinibacillus sp. PLM2]